jgi:O-antigen/teichoic acid export membrane protein
MIIRFKKIAYRLLKKSEKWTKTDMIYLAKGGFWLTIGQGVSSVSVFLLAIAFANLLPPEIYGNYKYILSIVALLAIPTLSGINTAIVQSVARGYEGSVISAFKTKVRWGLLGGLASIALAGYYYFNDNNTLAISFLIASVFIPFMDSFLVYDSYLNGKKDFKRKSTNDIVVRIISTIIMVGVIFFSSNIFLIIGSYFASHTALRAIFFKVTFWRNKLNERKDESMIPYGKHLSLMGVMNTISANIDKMLIFHYLGATELAVYSIAIAPIDQVKLVIKNISILSLPKFSHLKTNDIIKGLKQKLIKMSLILLVVSAVYIFIAPWLYSTFFPQYLGSIFYSQIFAISLVFVGPTAILSSLLKAKQKKRILYRYNIFKPMVKISLLFILLGLFGLLGLVMAMVITNVFELIFFLSIKINKKN